MEEFIGTRVPTKTKQLLEAWALHSGKRSLSSVVRQLIDEGIEAHTRQLELAGLVEPQETPENPTEDMRKNGVKELVA